MRMQQHQEELFHYCNVYQFPGVTTFTNCKRVLLKLQRLEISWCKNMDRLPDTLERLSYLNHLEIVGCEKISALPESFGNLNNLSTLIISHCNISGLPDSFSNLVKLTELSLSKCPLIGLPTKFEQLKLCRLIITRVLWTSVPVCIKYLSSLKTLIIELPALTEECPWLEQSMTTLKCINCFYVHNWKLNLIKETLESDDEE